MRKLFTILVLSLCATASGQAAKLKFNAQGALVQVLATSDDIAQHDSELPTATVVEFDADTNAPLLTDAARNLGAYTFSGGTVLKNGQPVTINGDGTLKISLDQAKALWTSIKTQAAFDALTAAQKAEALRKTNKMIILLLVKEGILSPQDFQ